MAFHAASRYGARVTGITLSKNQAELARARVREAGLEDRVDIRLEDDRDLRGEGVCGRIASIGNFEPVGPRNLSTHFGIVHRLLKPGGIALNHGITSSDADSRAVRLGAGAFKQPAADDTGLYIYGAR